MWSRPWGLGGWGFGVLGFGVGVGVGGEGGDEAFFSCAFRLQPQSFFLLSPWVFCRGIMAAGRGLNPMRFWGRLV